MSVKRIKFERTGGFAGIRLAAEFDLGDLPHEQADQLRELVDGLRFDELPENLTAKQTIPDGFTYSIAIQYEGYEHTVTTADGAIPEKMQPLLDILTQIARQRERKK
jgi:hypothetical protein